MLMLHRTNMNLFDTHPASKGPIFQIDGNFGTTGRDSGDAAAKP